MTQDCTVGLTRANLQEAMDNMDEQAARRRRQCKEFESMVRADAIRLPRSEFMAKYLPPITTWYGVDMGAGGTHES